MRYMVLNGKENAISDDLISSTFAVRGNVKYDIPDVLAQFNFPHSE